MVGALEGIDKNLFTLEITAHDEFISESNFRLIFSWRRFLSYRNQSIDLQNMKELNKFCHIIWSFEGFLNYKD